MTQYERDFERVSATVRKEVIRFEVLMFIPCCIHFSYWTAENVCYCSLMKCFCLIIQKEKAKNFKRQIIKYLESLLQSQQQVSVSQIKYFSCETSWFTFIMVSMLRKALSTTAVLVLTLSQKYIYV